MQKVYDVIPQLRSVSPPRFTTDGVPKTKLDFDRIGVKKLGKVLGNPYSRYVAYMRGLWLAFSPTDREDGVQIPAKTMHIIYKIYYRVRSRTRENYLPYLSIFSVCSSLQIENTAFNYLPMHKIYKIYYHYTGAYLIGLDQGHLTLKKLILTNFFTLLSGKNLKLIYDKNTRCQVFI